MIAPAARPDYVEIYVTSATGEARRVINKADIDALILTAVTNATELLIVEDIAERDALTLTATRYVFVKDATADATVDVGGLGSIKLYVDGATRRTQQDGAAAAPAAARVPRHIGGASA
jgi:hypothetical protein